MNTRLFLFLILLTLAPLATTVRADETITVSATNQDISDNLDLRAVATLFGEVNNLEEFERELNSDKRHLNNLDLNGDGIVDYLRVVEIGEGENRLIVLQAVLAKDIYQDVASIYVERHADNTVSVQVVGDDYLYGNNYIIEPVYIYRPVIYDWFWGPTWVCWNSPFYWGYYPSHYLAYETWVWHKYNAHIHHFHHSRPLCSYHYAHDPRPGMMSMRGSHHGERVIRNDWAKAHPEHNFTARASRRGSSATNAHQMNVENRRMARNTNNNNVSNNNSNSRASQGGSARIERAAANNINRQNSTFGSSNTRASVAAKNNNNTIRATNSSNNNVRASNNRASVANSNRSFVSTNNSRSSNNNTIRATNSSSNNVRSASGSSTRSSASSSMRSSSSSGTTMRSSASSSSGNVRASSGSSGSARSTSRR